MWERETEKDRQKTEIKNNKETQVHTEPQTEITTKRPWESRLERATWQSAEAGDKGSWRHLQQEEPGTFSIDGLLPQNIYKSV